MIFRAREVVPKSINARVRFLNEATMVPVGTGVSRVFLDHDILVGI